MFVKIIRVSKAFLMHVSCFFHLSRIPYIFLNIVLSTLNSQLIFHFYATSAILDMTSTLYLYCKLLLT